MKTLGCHEENHFLVDWDRKRSIFLHAKFSQRFQKMGTFATGG